MVKSLSEAAAFKDFRIFMPSARSNRYTAGVTVAANRERSRQAVPDFADVVALAQENC